MPERPNTRLSQRINEAKEHLQLNSDSEPDDDDALEYLVSECGQDSEGYCNLAGTEYCDFECPFRDEE
ncbi:MAG TPA: hypothetical protein VEF04_05200 [Blastocatellia bacterium]|nr:hypothetical protein [Blastocatellia bacterium]